MKTIPNPASRNPLFRQKKQGFALVVTLTLMVLLSILALGMLSLSTVSLRSMGQSDAQAVARANARMGLVIALGKLQTWAGADQRVTARADVLNAASVNPRLTGVWKSWEINPNTPPGQAKYNSIRTENFLGWLTSATVANPETAIGFANAPLANPVVLWDKGSLGSSPDPKDIVRASKITLENSPGSYAYAVLDEGVKARINTPFGRPGTTNGAKMAELGTGRVPKASAITGLENMKQSLYQEGSAGYLPISKGISRLNMGLAGEKISAGLSEQLKKRLHDVSPYSKGLFTNTVKGGLKKDMHLLTSTTLPPEYGAKGVYQTELGLSVVSDPSWGSVRQYASIYNDTTRLTAPGGLPVLQAGGPAGWTASTGSSPTGDTPGTISPAPPQGAVLMPTVAKVQLIFSLLIRDIYNYPKDTTPKPAQSEEQERKAQLHAPWGEDMAGSSYDYLLHLLYTPVVTLHNPYNVPLEFRQMKVLFGNVPFALQVFRNGIAQTKGPAPLDTMFYQVESGSTNKRFGMTLQTTGPNNEPGSTTFRLLPGEVMLFSPYVPPTRTFAQENVGQRIFTDWDSASGSVRTLELKGMPGWRGDGIGFDLDWFAPSYQNLRVTTNETENGRNHNRGGCIAARQNDRWNVKFSPISVPGISKNKFTVEIFANSPGTGTMVSSGLIEMDYGTPTGLQTALTENSSVDADGTLTYPKNGTIGTMEMHSHGTTAIKDIYTAKPFAVVSVQAKATKGGQNPDGLDGRLATKPWAFAHANGGATAVKITQEGMAGASHDVTFQRLDGSMDNYLQYDPATGRGNFITGQTGLTGLKFGVQREIPLTPVQSLAGLNGANPGGSSAYLPRFANPIGNSWAHPTLQPALAVTPGPAYPYADHSFLLNSALYDGYYFSGFAPRTGSFGSGETTATLAQQFAQGTSLADPRLSLHTPAGKKTADFPAVTSAADAYLKVAAWQMMDGAFNINSTSPEAWKAMLASVHDPDSLYLDAMASAAGFTRLPPTPDDMNRISRTRLPSGISAKGGGDPQQAYWLGAREYSDAELGVLAGKIVEQVQLRGPFLSMSEFVNRRLGPESDTLAQKGALQAAIDATDLNKPLALTAGAGYEIQVSQFSPKPGSTYDSYKYANKTAGSGPSYQGAPGYLTQADLLKVLGNAATPRSDTFTIRAYGEAKNKAGSITATAFCEAVVQRVPEYVDPANAPDALPAALTVTNKEFGRRFEIVLFRWLNSNEI